MTQKEPPPMTREQARLKLEDDPVLQFTYQNIPGPGETNFQMGLSPSDENMKDLVNNLPLAAADKLASLAIMLSPPQAP
jgi:hypothetical protein